MKISIITVCYNSASTICDTFESMLEQTYPDIEYIVVDGNSTDGTLSIIKEYESKFNGKMRWISEPDNGLYDAMNKGIKIAKGDVVGILNSDDCYASELVLESVIKSIKNVDSCYGNLIYLKNKKPHRFWRAGNQKSFKYGWMPPHPSFFVRRYVYEKYGLFRIDCGVNSDYELMLRFLEVNNISTMWLDQVLVCMTAGGRSNNGFKSRMNAIDDNKIAWQVNNIKPYFFTLFLKRLIKVPQFYKALFHRMKIQKKIK